MKIGVIGLVSTMAIGISAPAFAQAAPTTGNFAPEAAPAAQPAPATAPAEAPATAAPAAPAAAPTEFPAPEQNAEKPANERTANNALYVELLGAGLFYSLNYDRRFGDVAVRAGLMYFSVSASSTDGNGGTSSASASWIGVPLSVSYVGIGSAKHSFEIGGGITIHHIGGSTNTLGVDSSGSDTLILGHAILGYRYQPLDTGFFLRAGLTPIFGSGVFVPWPHVGLGATF